MTSLFLPLQLGFVVVIDIALRAAWEDYMETKAKTTTLHLDI